MVRMVRMVRTKWTQIQNKIMRKNECNGQIGQNGQSGHKFKIKS